ncbi:glycosyltransferase family 39 protein [Aquabacterium sp.]|uniref:ArnT family glycosyltransferase n=1 Tax=Aquabacterium sp. TaxID=1872578 RepID=UPI0025C5C189|nr:glycosyltransferase family 39 protein [Aquabacterium sp.]
MKPSSAVPPTPSASASRAQPSGPVPRWPRLWGPRTGFLLAFVALLMAYRMWAVGHTGISLFFDEAQYWDWSKHLAWGYFSKPPLIAGLIWLSTALFGEGVLGVKLLCMLLYPATALAMVGLARALWPTSGGVRTGIVAAALFMSIPVVGLMGLFASTDAPLILCWTLASWALWRAQVTDRLVYWVLTGLACGVGLMGKYTMAAFALTAIWTLWGVPGPRRGVLRLGPWVTVLLAAALLAPNLIWNAQNAFPTLAHTAELTTQSNRQGGLFPAVQFLLGQVLMLGPVPVLAAIWLAWQGRGTQVATQGTPVSTSQWTHSTQQAGGLESGTLGRPVARQSAYHLASVSSFRFLWAMCLPLQGVAVVQALYADAHVNWAAPSMVGFTMLIASTLSAPLLSLSAPRPNRWLLAAVLSNLVLTTAVLHLREIAGPTMPSRLDVLVRMRGWQEAFDQIAVAMKAPTVQGLPLLTDQRLLITEAAYHLRHLNVATYAWNPKGQRNDHYQMTRSLPNKVGQDVLLLTANPKPDEITQRFAIVRELTVVKQPVGPDRAITLHLFFLRGFLGYDQETYLRQSGADQPPARDEL